MGCIAPKDKAERRKAQFLLQMNSQVPLRHVSMEYKVGHTMQDLSNLSTERSFCTIQENEKRKNMSLVLMMKSKYGLVAASDSKSTVSLGYGEELNRERQKIFAGENYLSL